MRAIKTLVRRLTFPKPPTNLVEYLITSFECAHTKVNEEEVDQAFIT